MFKIQMLYPTSVFLCSCSSNTCFFVWMFLYCFVFLLSHSCQPDFSPLSFPSFLPFLRRGGISLQKFFCPGEWHFRFLSANGFSFFESVLLCFISQIYISFCKGREKTPPWLDSAQNRRTKHHKQDTLYKILLNICRLL